LGKVSLLILITPADPSAKVCKTAAAQELKNYCTYFKRWAIPDLLALMKLNLLNLF